MFYSAHVDAGETHMSLLVPPVIKKMAKDQERPRKVDVLYFVPKTDRTTRM